MIKQEMIKTIEKEKIIVILRGLTKEQALYTSKALFDAGIRLVEYAYNDKTENQTTAETIATLNNEFKNDMLIGAGTVTTTERLDLAIQAGAKYIISPNIDTEIIRKTNSAELISMPGALTPSEIYSAHKSGADFVKVFPVASMQKGYIKSVLAPFSNIKLLAVGGVNDTNMLEYFKEGAAGIGVGANLADLSVISLEDYNEIKRRALLYVQKLEGVL